jgi:hypothetical protein
MGQYHFAINLDKKEYLNPHKVGDGLKLLEWSQDGMLGAMQILLAASDGRGGGDFNVDQDNPKEKVAGRWAGDRIAIIGDYYEVGDIPKVKDKKLWETVENTFKEISDLVIPTLERYGVFTMERKDGWRDRKYNGKAKPPKMKPDLVLTDLDPLSSGAK